MVAPYLFSTQGLPYNCAYVFVPWNSVCSQTGAQDIMSFVKHVIVHQLGGTKFSACAIASRPVGGDQSFQ